MAVKWLYPLDKNVNVILTFHFVKMETRFSLGKCQEQ